MEQTLAELAQLFIDVGVMDILWNLTSRFAKMGTLVDQQEETINDVESTAKDVEADAGKAYAFVFVTLTLQGYLTLHLPVSST